MKNTSKIKIRFISTIDSDNYIFEKVYEEVHKQGIEFKILDSKCIDLEFNYFLAFIEDASIVFTRLMGGKDAFKFFDRLKDFLSEKDISFIPLSTSSEIDLELDKATRVNNEVKLKVFKYLTYEGVANYKLFYLGQLILKENERKFENGQTSYNEPEQTYWQGVYYKNFKEVKAYVS